MLDPCGSKVDPIDSYKRDLMQNSEGRIDCCGLWKQKC